MKMASHILRDYERSGHLLGKGLDPKEIDPLVTSLRRRLGLSGEELDLSGRSLKLIEETLMRLGPPIRAALADEEQTMHFIRELSAYVGETLRRGAGGRWENRGSLLGTKIVIDGGMTVVKDGERRKDRSVAFSLGNIACVSIDGAVAGKRPVLRNLFASARNKLIKEDY